MQGLQDFARLAFRRVSESAMAGETGGRGDREGPSPPGPINSISWVGPGRDPIYNKMDPFNFSWTVFQQLQ